MRDSTIDKLIKKEPTLGKPLPLVDDGIPVVTPNDGTSVHVEMTSNLESRRRERKKQIVHSPGYMDHFKSRVNKRRRAKFLQATEFQECEALMKWRDLNLYRLPKLSRLIHVPNGELRSKAAGAKLKKMGVSAGFPDYVLWVAHSGYHGLVFEMKREDGDKPSGTQQAWMRVLEEEGYYCTVTYGWLAARDLLEAYLDEKVLPAEGRV